MMQNNSPAERLGPATEKPASDRSPSRLGRGLAALIGDVDTEGQAIDRARSQRRLPIEFLRPNPRNPRQSFSEDDLSDLAASIGKKGVLQPIVVRHVDGSSDRFEIIAGERRWRAAQRAGLHEVPVVVHRVDDREALEIAIIENVQRSDLNPLEEAAGYERLIAEFRYTQEQLSSAIGKSRSHVANTLRLLKLPESVKAYLRDGRLTAGHARALVSQSDPESLARAIVENDLNVREAEALVQAPKTQRLDSKDADTRALEKRLADAIGLKIDIRHRPNGRGALRIQYNDLEQLQDVARRLLGTSH